MRGVERLRHRLAFAEELLAPAMERHFPAVHPQAQLGLAAARGDTFLVVRLGSDFLGRVGRAVAEQAVSRKMSSMRMVPAVMPTGAKGSRSINRTSTLSPRVAPDPPEGQPIDSAHEWSYEPCFDDRPVPDPVKG